MISLPILTYIGTSVLAGWLSAVNIHGGCQEIGVLRHAPFVNTTIGNAGYKAGGTVSVLYLASWGGKKTQSPWLKRGILISGSVVNVFDARHNFNQKGCRQ